MVKYLWKNVFDRSQTETTIFKFLKDSYLFQDLNKKELEFLCQIVHIRQFRPGEIIFNQGDPGVGMYLLLSGTVDIVMKNGKEDSPEANDVFITRLIAGDFFGELSLVEEPSYRSASAISKDRTHLIGFFKPDLLQVIQRNPVTGNKICIRLAEILGRRLRETTEKIGDLLSQNKSLTTDSETKNSYEKHFTS